MLHEGHYYNTDMKVGVMSKLKGQMWGGATLPMLHEGHYYNTDMKVRVMSIRFCGFCVACEA